MNRTLFCLFFTMLFFTKNLVHSQGGTNEASFMSMSPDAMASSKTAGTDVNIYTGLPSISLPLYNYSHRSGLGLSMTLDYSSGGVRTNESPSSVGLGWNINVGGIITRTVRGMPDEYPSNGFLYSGALPTDPRTNAKKYYFDSIDAQQDVFQFNFNGRSGKFLIGKNNQIVIVPLSKIKIQYNSTPDTPTAFGAFTITTEDGVKYVFSDAEKTSSNVVGNVFAFGYQNFSFPTAWYLTRIIAPFGPDYIQFNYNSITTNNAIAYPKSIRVNSGGTQTEAFEATGTRTTLGQRTLASIEFPDKKNIQFKYHGSLQYDNNSPILSKLYFCDSIFRYGFYFQRKEIYTDTIKMVGIEDSIPPPISRNTLVTTDQRGFLSGVQYFTKTATIPGYVFTYSKPFFKSLSTLGDTVANKHDHWGFYKGAIPSNANSIPVVSGIYPTGIDRSVSYADDVKASCLFTITDPAGGLTVYDFERNSIYPYSKVSQLISINAINATQSNITLNQIVSNQYVFNIGFNSSVSRITAPSFSGTANLTCSITSTDGLTTIASKTISLFQAFYVGSVTFSASIPNGNYLFKTTISGGTTAPSGLPVDISWNNEVSAGGTETITGGLRIKNIFQLKAGSKKLNSTSYKYVNADGKSSGFYGLLPVYHYPITKVLYTNNLNPVTNYETVISAEPVRNIDFTQGNIVGYSRVEVSKDSGALPGKLGKVVYEFTSAKEAAANVAEAKFPFAPGSKRDWAIGLPKRTLFYDSSGRMIKSTTNTYSISNVSYENANFQSLKLGLNREPRNYNTSTNVNSIVANYFTGQIYYPESGRADLITSIDTFYHPTGAGLRPVSSLLLLH